MMAAYTTLQTQQNDKNAQVFRQAENFIDELIKKAPPKKQREDEDVD